MNRSVFEEVPAPEGTFKCGEGCVSVGGVWKGRGWEKVKSAVEVRKRLWHCLYFRCSLSCEWVSVARGEKEKGRAMVVLLALGTSTFASMCRSLFYEGAVNVIQADVTTPRSSTAK